VADHPVAADKPSWYGTLVASQDDTVTFDRDCDSVEVVNRDGAGEIWFTVNGELATVEGADAYWVPPTPGAALAVDVRRAGDTVVHLLSPGTPKVGVTGSF
jgi:hypothetical protein